MEELTYVERENGKLYCFIEVCKHTFPNVPKSTVRNWCKSLEIQLLTCTSNERSCFKEKIPGLGGAFGLIKEVDLQRLEEYQGSKRAKFSHQSSSQTTAVIGESRSKFTNNFPTSAIVSYSESSDEDPSPSMLNESEVPSSSSCSATIDVDKPAEITTGTPTTHGSRKRIQLSIHECSESLKKELSTLVSFYTRTLNPNRQGPAFAKATIDKMKERAMCFLFYCKNNKKTEQLSLDLFNNIELFTEYLEHLKDERKLKPSTLVATVTSAINVVKFNLSNSSSTNPNSSPQIQSYQSFQRQFQKESTILAKRSKEGLSGKSTEKFYFAHVLETLRGIRDRYFETTGLNKSRHLHDFVLLATFVRGIPGRSKELRTMKLFDENDKNQLFEYEKMDSGNFIVFQKDERVVILQLDFKTSKTCGPTKIDLSDDECLVYYLKQYLKIRLSLLCGQDHDFFFCNKRGLPFDCSASIAKYFGDIFQREVSIRASTTALRHSIVTYFSSLEESKDISIRKSLALLMKHSVRYQEQVYNDQSTNEIVKPAREILRTKIASNVFDNDFDNKESSSSEEDDESSGEEFVLKPKQGDIVALLDPISTINNVEFFLAKVARYSFDKSEVHLIHLQRLESEENMFRLKPGRVWTESTKSLIFPVDVVWNHNIKAYELRTLAEEIYESVHGKNLLPS